MLKKLRQTLAVLFFLAVTALFLDFTGTVHAWLGWTAKPPVPAGSVGIEPGCDNRTGRADTALRSRLLLNYLSVGCDAGHRIVDQRTAEKRNGIAFPIPRKRNGCATAYWDCSS